MKIPLLSGLLLSCQILFSQISFNTAFAPGQSFNVNPCDTITYFIDFTDGEFDAIEDTIYFNTESADITFINASSVAADIDISENGDSLILTNITLTDFQLAIDMHFPCAFNDESTYMYEETFEFTTNGDHSTTIDQFITVNSAYLILDNVVNKTVVSDLLINIDRTFNFINTSATTPFNGVLHFVDTLSYNFDEALTNFDTIYHETSGVFTATEIDRQITDSIIEIWIKVEDMGEFDTLQIIDVAKLIGCLAIFNTKDQTNYYFEYGCNIDDLCKIDEDASAYKTRIEFDEAFTPDIEVTFDTEHASCFSDTTARLISFKNTGTGNADGIEMQFGIQTLAAYQLSDIESGSVKAYLNEIAVDTEIPLDLFEVGTGGGFDKRYYFTASHIIAPGDSVIVTYNEVFECASVADDLLYNQEIGTHSIVFYATLTHPCKPVVSTFVSPDFTYHHFSMPQEFFNLVGLMGDAQTEWMEIETSSTLELGRESANQVAYDPETLKINFLISLEQGLKFTSLDSIEFVNPTTGTVLIPDDVSYVGLSSMVGNGDTVLVSISIPPSFFAPYGGVPSSNHEIFEVTPAFTEFFIGSVLRFNVCGVCEYSTPNGVANISQKSYLQINPDCSDCIIPLAAVQDYTNINCPGCLLPGWNMTKFDILRQNYGFKDTNDNHFPDIYPKELATADDANLNKASLGDTMRFCLEGFLSDGESGDLDSNGVADGATFASIGFDFTEGRIRMTNAGITDFEFLGGTGAIKISGTYYPFVIPIGAGEFTIHDGNDAFIIPMGTVDLISYGVASFIAYDATNLVTLELDFRLKANPVSGSGSNPFKSIYPITCFYDIAGNPFDEPAEFIYANDHVDSIVGLTPDERKNFMYWCTANEGRYIGLGSRFSSYGNAVGYYEADACRKNFQGRISGYVGHDFVAGQVPASAGDAYEYELRDFWRFDTVTLNFPDDYKIEQILIKHHNPVDNDDNVTIFAGPSAGVSFVYPIDEAVVTSTSVQFYPYQVIDELTEYTAGPPYLGGHDETKKYLYLVSFVPVDCQNLPDSTMHDLSNAAIKIGNLPYGSGADTLVETNLLLSGGIVPAWDNPDPEIDVNIVSGGALSGNEIGWDLTLATQAIPPVNSIQRKLNNTDRRAENTFIYLQSPSGNLTNLTANNLIRYTNDTPFPIASFDEEVIAGDTLYGIGPLGGNYTQIYSASLSINALYDCATLSPGDQDSIYVIYGWNCFEYPTNIDSACFADTLVLYFNTPIEGLQTEAFFPESITICETETISLEFDPTGISALDSVSVVVSGFGDVLNLEHFTSSVSIDGVTVSHEIITDELVVQVDSLFTYNEASSTFIIEFSYDVHCDTDFDSLIFSLDAFNACGSDLLDVTYVFAPVIEGAIIESDIDSITISTLLSAINACDSVLNLSIILNNTSGATFEGQTFEFDFESSVVNAIAGYPFIIDADNNLQVDYTDILLDGEADTLELEIELALLNCGINDFELSYTVVDTVTCFGDTCVSEIAPFIYPFNFTVESEFTGYDTIIANQLCLIDGALILVSEGNTNLTDIEIYDAATGDLLDSELGYDWSSDSVYFDVPPAITELTVITSQCVCADTLTLSLDEAMIDSSMVSLAGCDSVVYEGETFTESSSDTLVLTNLGGCDSIIFLDVTINYTTVSNNYTVHCDETSCFEDGDVIDTVFVSNYILENEAGCDSVVNSYIILIPTHAFTEDIVSCESIIWRDMTIDSTGYYADTLTSIYGCDSIIKLEFILAAPITITDTLVDCASITFNDSIYFEDATVIETYLTDAGCDSTVTTLIDITDADTLYATLSICDWYLYAGDTLSASGIYYHSYINEEGCPEVEELTLTILESYSNTESITVCFEYSWNDSLYTETTIDSAYYTASSGCDSILILDLVVQGYDTIDVYIEECEEYEWYGMTYTSSGTYYEYIADPLDCDNVEVLHLTIFDSDTSYVEVTACDEYILNSAVITESGIYYSTVTDTNGCVIVEELTLTIIDLDITISATETEFTSNEEFATYQWISCDPYMVLPGETNQNFTAIDPDLQYAVILQNGDCIDTSACIDYESVANLSTFDLIGFTITPNPSNGEIFITHQADDLNYTIQLYDPTGKLIATETDIVTNNKQVELPAARGLYLIIITDSDMNQRIFKIVRQ